MASMTSSAQRRRRGPDFVTPGGGRLSELDDEMSDTFRQRKPGAKKTGSEAGSGGRIGIFFKMTIAQHFLLLFGFIAFATVSLLLFVPNPIEPKVYSLPVPLPEPSGALALNEKLAKANKILAGSIRGAESLQFVSENVLFTGTLDGRIVRVDTKIGQVQEWARLGPANCSKMRHVQPVICGRPLGVRLDPSNASRVLVADAYLGLFAVSVQFSYRVETLIDRNHPIGVTFFDDLDITAEGMVYLSEASQRHPLHSLMLEGLEHSQTGRLLRYNLHTGEALELVNGLSFANGVQLHPDGESVLLAETTAFRISRYHFAGDKKGQLTVFADNLPGAPDNIRLSSDGKSLWLSSGMVRMAHHPGMIDTLSVRPWLRLLAAKFVPNSVSHRMAVGSYGLVLQVSLSGDVIDSWHDSSGKVITHCSEVREVGGKLYLGSYYAGFIGVLQL